MGNFRVGFEGSVTISRKDWAVHWKAAPATTLGLQLGDAIVIRNTGRGVTPAVINDRLHP